MKTQRSRQRRPLRRKTRKRRKRIEEVRARRTRTKVHHPGNHEIDNIQQPF
jgi:hypothetical protein